MFRNRLIGKCLLNVLFAAVILSFFGCSHQGGLTPEKGVTMSMQNSNLLYVIPEGVQTRWASGENPSGEKGKAAQANGGRKSSQIIVRGRGGKITT